jgi:hypothetical protein
MHNNLERLTERANDVGQAFVDGGISGFISNLVTWFVNMLKTTAKHIIGIIREAILAIVKAFRTVFFSSPEVSIEEKIREAAKIIAGAAAVGVGILLEEALKNLLASVPFLQAFASEISAAISAIITGLMTALAIFLMDRLFDHLQYPINEEFIGEIASDLNSQEQLVAAAEAAFSNFGGILVRFESMLMANQEIIEACHEMIEGEEMAISKISLA